MSTRPRWRRRLRFGFGVAAAIAVLGLVALSLVLEHLDGAFVKPRLQRLVYRAAGVELDFATTRASLTGGLHLTSLTIATPPALRSIEPYLLRIGSLDIGWGVGRLASTSPSVDDVVVRDVEVTLVLDASGKSSLDLSPPSPTAPTPAEVAPRSTMVRDLLATPLPLRGASIGPVHVTVIRSDKGVVVERYKLEGLTLEARREGARTTLGLGKKGQPLDLRLHSEGTRPGDATVRLWLEGSAENDHAELALETRLVGESLDPQLERLAGPQLLFGLSVGVRTEPKAHRLVATVTSLELADKVTTLTAEVELPDDLAAPPLLRSADAHLDAKLALSLLPPALASRVPHLASGTIEVRARKVELSTMPRVLEGGQLAAKGAWTKLRFEQPGLLVDVPSVRVDVSTGVDRRIHAKLDLDVELVRFEQAKLSVALHDAKLALSTRSDDVAKAPSSTGTLSAHAGRLEVVQAGKSMVDEALHATLFLDELRVAPTPAASTCVAKLEATLGALSMKLSAKKGADELDYGLDLSSPSLAALGAVVGSADVPWSHIGLELASKGRVEHVSSSPLIAHDTQLTLSRPSMRGSDDVTSAQTVSLSLVSHGDAKRHEGDLTIGVVGLVHGSQQLGDGHVKAHLRADLAAPTVAVDLSGTGSAAPNVDGKLDVGFDRKARRLRVGVHLALSHLDPLGPVVSALHDFDVEGVEVAIDGKGALTGVVEAFGSDGSLRLAADPLHHVGGDADLGLSVRRFGWHDQARWLTTPEITWHGTLHAAGDSRQLHGALKIAQLHVAIGPSRFDLGDLSDALVIGLEGNPKTADLHLDETMTLRKLKQDVAPAYATGDISLTLHGSSNHDGVVRVPELQIENLAAGTRVVLAGGLDLGEDRRSLSLRGSLDQDLAKAWGARQDFIGRGQLSAQVRVQSGDLHRFHTESALSVEDGDLELPRQKIKVTTLDGEIPVVADVRLDNDGPHLQTTFEVNNYSELRFADQHPMLSRRSFFKVARIETPWATLAPLVGNLVIENNVVSVSQVEMGVREGRVTGRAAVVVQGNDSTVELNVRASHVMSTHGEPFDGNAAVAISARQRSIEGRLEILRIGRRHLLDLLDVVDPPRTDGAINRVRRALAVGYPDHVRVSFLRGFASAQVTFGGVARLLKLDEIKGIPMGPIIDRVLAPVLHEDEEE